MEQVAYSARGHLVIPAHRGRRFQSNAATHSKHARPPVPTAATLLERHHGLRFIAYGPSVGLACPFLARVAGNPLNLSMENLPYICVLQYVAGIMALGFKQFSQPGEHAESAPFQPLHNLQQKVPVVRGHVPHLAAHAVEALVEAGARPSATSADKSPRLSH